MQVSHRVEGSGDVWNQARVGDEGDVDRGIQGLDATRRDERFSRVVVSRLLPAVREEQDPLPSPFKTASVS